jgi:peroxiredoxin
MVVSTGCSRMKIPYPFQRKLQSAFSGPNGAKMTTRIIVVLAVIGALAIIIAGLLRPNTPQATSTTSASAPASLQVGSLAPNFTLTTLDGKRIHLSDYRDKAVMLNFWYTTCPGCLQEIPGMQRFYAAQQATGKNFVILGVNIADDAQTASHFVKQYGLTYPIVLDQNQQVLTLYNVNSTPTSYFIDRQGIIRSIVIGPVDNITLQQNVAMMS